MKPLLALAALLLPNGASHASPALAPVPVTAAFAAVASDEVEDWIDLVERRSTDYFEVKERRSAVRKLAERGGDDAWSAVILALGDPEPMVADEAQLQLAQLTDPDLVEDLFGKRGLKSKEDHVPERAAEALGRLAVPVDRKALAKGLSAKDATTRRLLCWSIERLALAGHLDGDGEKQLRDTLSKVAVRDKDDGVRGAALVALGAVEPEMATAMCASAVLEPEPEVRCAVALLFGRGLGNAPVETLTYLLDDRDDGVRTGAVLALAQIGTVDAARALAAHLRAEPSLRVRHRMVARLQELSGLRHKLDPRPWTDWAATLEDDFVPASAEGARSDGVRESEAELASLPLRTQRMALLIDFSGSIWDPDNAIDGRTRKEWLEEQLEVTLGTFSVETHFNLIPYTYDPIPWEDEARSATPKTAKQALAWFQKRKEQGKGNYYDAAVLALGDRGVDSLITFSDGAPSGGYHWNLELMFELLLEQNRFRNATFDALLVGTKGGLLKHWQHLAAETDGQVIVLGGEGSR